MKKLAKECLEYYKKEINGNSHVSSEDQNDEENADSKDGSREVSNGIEDSVGNWTTGHPCYSLAKNLSICSPCPETLLRLSLKIVD